MDNLVFVSFLVIHLITILLPSCSAEPVTAVATISFISSIFTIIGYLWTPTPILSKGPIDDSFFSFMHAMGQFQISEKLTHIEQEIERMYEHIPVYTNYIKTVQNQQIQINKIDQHYKIMLEITRESTNETVFNSKDQNDVDEYLSIHHGTLFEAVSSIHSTFINHNSTTLKYLKKNLQKHYGSCSETGELQSNQQSFLNFIASIVIAQAKVYMTAKMAASYINKTEGVYPTKKFNTVSTGVIQQYKDTVKLFKDLMAYAPRDVWVCDPELHIENTTFIQLVNLFQKQIVTSVNTRGLCLRTSFHHVGKCKEVDVSGVKVTDLIPDPTSGYEKYPGAGKLTGYYDMIQKGQVLYGKNSLRNNRVCQGYLWDCEPLNQLFDESERDHTYLICHSLDNSTRRFDRIESHTIEQSLETRITFRRHFGQPKLCDFSQHRKSTIRNAGVCTCDETTSGVPALVHSHYTYRFFFTGQVFVSNNYILTGAKIGQYKGVIYPIIQEGKLLKEGVVDQSTLRWIDYADYSIHRERIINRNNIVRVGWTDRTIKLGDVNLPAGQLLRGLYFTRRNWENNIDGPLRLALVWSKFNFTTGVIDPTLHDKDDYGKDGEDRFHYINSDMIPLDNLPVPKLDEKHNIIITNGYLNITTSEFKTDLGQTTIPYFDTQNVMTEIPMPMSGAGLYYKYRPGSSGFIGIKLKTYDISPYIKEPQDTIPESVKKAIEEGALSRNRSLAIIFG